MTSRLTVAGILFFIVFTSVKSQSVMTQMGARSNGLAYTSACLSDEWSLFNNIGGLAKITHIQASTSYDLHPQLAGANRMAAVFTVPIKVGVTGIGAFRFGDALYNEQVFTLGYANSLGIASLGVRVNYIQYYAEGFGTKGVIAASFGGIAEIVPQFFIGAHITNLNQPDLSENEKTPTLIAVGVGFNPTKKVWLTSEIEKDIEYKPIWKGGVEYQAHKKFYARTGFNINPNAMFFGLSFKTHKVTIDYALQHSVLFAISHQASIGYKISTL